MIPDMIHTPYIAPRISVMAPPPVTAERFVDELLSGLCMPDGGFVAHLAPSGDPFSNGWNAAMKLQASQPTSRCLPMPVNVIFHNSASVNRAIDRICAAYIEDETVLADQEGRDPVLIRHFSAHNLRHTFCTRFCENERNIKVIQEIMGHADIETTMNIYAEATKEKKKESFSNLEGKIKIS